jgi:hypothetical protein
MTLALIVALEKMGKHHPEARSAHEFLVQRGKVGGLYRPVLPGPQQLYLPPGFNPSEDVLIVPVHPANGAEFGEAQKVLAGHFLALTGPDSNHPVHCVAYDATITEEDARWFWMGLVGVMVADALKTRMGNSVLLTAHLVAMQLKKEGITAYVEALEEANATTLQKGRAVLDRHFDGRVNKIFAACKVHRQRERLIGNECMKQRIWWDPQLIKMLSARAS